MGRGLFIWGKPIWVARDADERALEAKRRELEETLKAITKEADDVVSCPSDPSPL